ncbi:hypothetical protein DUI87_06506 [Hirundo rustica rustica]|uniref:Integrase catalytic domain-containing protein n=1 Tax=Hirundo rustica rustica TaxID=333673 RepID=A0A3M0KTE9_HIRRU|nr:hypothetical protein DUI87_06506 [Hirundo rustica rustica]
MDLGCVGQPKKSLDVPLPLVAAALRDHAPGGEEDSPEHPPGPLQAADPKTPRFRLVPGGDPETAMDENGNALTLEHLMGEGRWTDPTDQASGIPIKALQTIREHAVTAFFSMVPDGPVIPYYKIVQGTKEAFTKFVERLTRAIEVQVAEVAVREGILREMVFANANGLCRNAILSLPLDPPPTLQDMLLVCQLKVPYMQGNDRDAKSTTPRVAAISGTQQEHIRRPVRAAGGESLEDATLEVPWAGDRQADHCSAEIGHQNKGEKAGDVIKHLIHAFSFLGIPKELKTDNGPAYKSRELCSFLQQWGVEHKTGIPHSPTVNHVIAPTEESPEEEGLELEEVLAEAPEDDGRGPDEEEHGLGYPTQHH